MEQIVVGVDGSESSKRAARWAVAHAGPADEVTLTCAYELTGLTGLGPAPETAEDVERDAQAMLDGVAEEIRAVGGPSVRTHIHHGHAGHFLVNRSRIVDHIVVGSRGVGGFLGLHLGSCSSYVTHHAACSVTVVRDRSEAS